MCCTRVIEGVSFSLTSNVFSALRSQPTASSCRCRIIARFPREIQAAPTSGCTLPCRLSRISHALMHTKEKQRRGRKGSACCGGGHEHPCSPPYYSCMPPSLPFEKLKSICPAVKNVCLSQCHTESTKMHIMYFLLSRNHSSYRYVGAQVPTTPVPVNPRVIMLIALELMSTGSIRALDVHFFFLN